MRSWEAAQHILAATRMRRLLERFLERLRSPTHGLASSRAPLAVVVLSMLLIASSLGDGLTVDDHFHKLWLTHDARWAPILKPWYELFTFYDGDPARTQWLVESGLTVWWTDPNLVCAFFRPVSAATHALDYLLWPSQPWLMHAQSIAWYGALVWVVARLYRRLLSRNGAWVAGLAAALYGFDHNHALPAGWLANRNAVVAAFFALASLAAHDVAVRGPSTPSTPARPARPRAWAALSAVLFALALGSGESALGVAGFFAAHAMFLDPRAWRARILALSPFVAVVAAWAVLYRSGGFGVRGSGMYIEAGRNPGMFLGTLVKHLPLLIASELGGPTPDVYQFLPSAGQLVLVAIGLVFVAWSARALLLLWRADRVARFFLAGGVLAALPACSVFPAGRLLTIAGFGFIGVVALAGAGVADGAAWVPKVGARHARWVRSFSIWACGGHLLLSPAAMQIGLFQMKLLKNHIDHLGAQLPASAEAAPKRIIYMNTPDSLFACYFVIARRLAGEQVPSRMLSLAAGARAVDIKRTDEHTVVVHTEGGLYRVGTEVVTRTGAMPVGTKVHLTDIDIEVLQVVTDGAPTETAFHFATSADSDGYVWIRWEDKKLLTVHPPAVGEHVAIPGQVSKPW